MTPTATELYENVAQHVSDPHVSALLAEAELIPISGPGAPVSPPTYAKEEGASPKDKEPRFAVSEGVPLPMRSENGWFQSLAKDPATGEPQRGAQVILDSVGSQSGRAEKAVLVDLPLGPTLPGIFLEASDQSEGEGGPRDLSTVEAQVRAALRSLVSTWTTAHRQADAWMKFAQTSDGQQVWQGGKHDGVVIKDLIIQANPSNGELFYSLFPNSAIYGYWLSSGTAARHRLPRAYSSQVVGYGAIPIKVGATMLDESGGASSSTKVEVVKHELKVNPKGTGKKHKPSDVGFGPVPAPVFTRAYSCELILQRASVSLPVLRQIRFRDPQARNAALAVLVLLAMLGHELANEDGFYRSGCALVQVESRWGWRFNGRPASEIEQLAVANSDQIREALRLAVSQAERVGLKFRAPIKLAFSEAEKDIIKERVSNEDSKQGRDEGEGA